MHEFRPHVRKLVVMCGNFGVECKKFGVIGKKVPPPKNYQMWGVSPQDS